MTAIHVKPLRIGVLGCGTISGEHLSAWSRCQGASVVAVCDPTLARAEARAREYGIPGIYQAAEAMLSEEELDAVDIVTPRETHGEMIRLAARYGKHVLCEKPLCPTFQEASATLREIGPEIRIMVNENWRYRGYFRRIASWLSEGRLGTVTQVRVGLWRSSMLPRAEDGLIHSLTRQPFLARESHVLIAESLIHEIDVVRALFGEVEVLACATARACGAIVGEDNATLLLRTSYGVPVTIDATMTAAGHDRRSPDRVEIAGTRCSVILERAVLRLIGAENETHQYDESKVRQECFDASIRHFVDSIFSGARFWTSAEDQLAGLQVMDDAYRLAGTPVPLAPRTVPQVPPPSITGLAV